MHTHCGSDFPYSFKQTKTFLIWELTNYMYTMLKWWFTTANKTPGKLTINFWKGHLKYQWTHAPKKKKKKKSWKQDHNYGKWEILMQTWHGNAKKDRGRHNTGTTSNMQVTVKTPKVFGRIHKHLKLFCFGFFWSPIQLPKGRISWLFSSLATS